MGRNAKTLLDLVEDGTFLARRHHELLDGDLLRWKTLSKLQVAYREAGTDFERRRIALEFEKAVPKLLAKRESSSLSLKDAMDKLGPPKSAERLKRFFPTYLRWEDGKPFRLDRYQVEIIDEGWRRDAHDRRIYKEIITGIPRGNGKTPFWSGIGTATTLDGAGRPKVFQTSGAATQAKLGTAYVADWIDENPDLRRWLRASANAIRRRDGRGEYSIMAASGSLGHGRKPTIGMVDEWWTIEHAQQEKTVTALETAIFKLPEAFTAKISTAGYSKQTQLGEAYDRALKLLDVRHFDDGFHWVARDEEAGFLFMWWGLPDGYELDLEDDKAVLRAIKRANPASWVDHRELLRALKRALLKGDDQVLEWLRFNLNSWTKTKAGWLPTGAWWRLVSEAEIPDGAEIFVAVDAAKTRDTSACAWGWRDPNGRIVIRTRVWTARDDVEADVFVPGGRIRNRLVKNFIADELAVRYRIKEIVGDPRFFDVFLEELGDEGFRTAEFDQQGGLMWDAVQHFYEAVIEATVLHLGANEPAEHEGSGKVLAAHVAAAAGVLQKGGWYIFKENDSNPIDALTAAIMVRERAARSVAEDKAKRSVYNKRDLRVVELPAERDDWDDDEESTEASLIRRRRQAERAELARLLVAGFVYRDEPIPWESLDVLDARSVNAELAAAAERFAKRGQDERANACLEEQGRRAPTDDDE